MRAAEISHPKRESVPMTSVTRLDGEERDRRARRRIGHDAFGSSAFSPTDRAGAMSYCSAGETRDQKSLNSILSNIADALVTLPSCISKSQK